MKTKTLLLNTLFILFGMLLSNPLFAQQAAAQQTIRLSPNEAVEMAIRNNLSLESARVAAGTRQRASDLSWNQFIPSVTVGGTLNRLNEEPQGMTLPFPPPMEPITIPGGSQWQAVGAIQTTLNLNFAMFENMNRLRLDYQGGLIAYNKAKLQLERDVRKAYNNMLLLQENISLLHESFEAAERRVDLAEANFRAGRAPELPFLQAQLARENMKPMIDSIENAYRISQASFAIFLGLPYNTLFELIPLEREADFISLDVDQLILSAAISRPDIQELRHTILVLESARKMQKNSLLPNLSLSWNYNPVLSDPWNNSWFDSNNWADRGSFSITLGLRLHSLFPFSQDFQGIRNLDDQITGANMGLAQMIQGTEIEIYNTVLSLDRTRTTAEVQMQTVNLGERVYRLTEDAFRAGVQDLLQVQNAELELRQARVSLLEQQFNYLNDLIDLEYLIGVPFGTLSSTGSIAWEE
jgi:outer membrane protein TolC